MMIMAAVPDLIISLFVVTVTAVCLAAKIVCEHYCKRWGEILSELQSGSK